MEGDDVFLELPRVEVLDEMMATEKTCNSTCHVEESKKIPPKKSWSTKPSKVVEMLVGKP